MVFNLLCMDGANLYSYVQRSFSTYSSAIYYSRTKKVV